MTARRWAAVALAGLALAASGCGAPTSGVHPVGAPQLPAGSPESTSSTKSPAPTEPGPADVQVVLYFVAADGRLAPVPFTVAAARDRDVLVEVLDLLSSGPSQALQERGYSSALAPDVELRLTLTIGPTAYVDISFPGREPAPDEIPLAVGQIVLSATSVATTSQVILSVEGEQIDAPLPGGQRKPGPLAASDYASLLASPRVIPS